ncbi:arabinose efflux permease family protein [Rhizobium sp. CF122]|uniref:MFS transporter n=1 Tax=Rhizobium sp. CF122 TaxID=1144312 RepID=UPI000271BA6E|nr:MFS transporter [Rhizobium sp. CF122]EJL53524.1 arabinose efflux permease family protein [Rhizobium sp. CF122]
MTHHRQKFRTLAAEAAMILGGFIFGTSEFAAMGLLPEMAKANGVAIDVAGASVTSYALGVVFGAPLIAIVSARTPRHLSILILLAIGAVGNILTSLTGNFPMLIVARFVSGLPHGAYFGIAALIAAAMAGHGRRAQAVARVMMGLSVANLLGSPIATFIGEGTNWRIPYFLIGAVALVAALGCHLTVPKMPAAEGSGAAKEMGALARPQVWLTFAIGSLGLSGLFAVYTYLVPTLISVTGIGEQKAPLFLVIIGCGMVVGNFFGGWLADKGVMRAIGLLLALNVIAFALFLVSVHSAVLIAGAAFLAGFSALALVAPLQARLMDVAGHAQSLGAMLNGCAINVANAVGASLGGALITTKFGPASTGVVGVGLGIAALVVFSVSLKIERHHHKRLSLG